MEIILGYVLKAVGVIVSGMIIAASKKVYNYFGLKVSEEYKKIFENKVITEIYAVEETIARKVKEKVNEKILAIEKKELQEGVIKTVQYLDKALEYVDAKKIVFDLVANLPDVGAFKF